MPHLRGTINLHHPLRSITPRHRAIIHTRTWHPRHHRGDRTTNNNNNTPHTRTIPHHTRTTTFMAVASRQEVGVQSDRVRPPTRTGRMGVTTWEAREILTMGPNLAAAA